VEVGETPLLPRDEEIDLAHRVGEGDIEARNQMVLANLRLVVRIAGDFCGRGLGLDDLMAYGNLGLIAAVERFDPARKVRFSTFAAHWIRQSIRRGIQNAGRSVRFPNHMHTLLGKWRRATGQLHEELGRTPTPDEVAARLRLSPRKRRAVELALQTWNGSATTDSGSAERSLEETVEDRLSSGGEWGEDVTGERAAELLDELDERERTILRLRFGLGDGQALTLQEVGQRMNLTRERIRQIERLALAKLRERLAG
jgi:RNA polymerase primary sigma factor